MNSKKEQRIRIDKFVEGLALPKEHQEAIAKQIRIACGLEPIKETIFYEPDTEHSDDEF